MSTTAFVLTYYLPTLQGHCTEMRLSERGNQHVSRTHFLAIARLASRRQLEVKLQAAIGARIPICVERLTDYLRIGKWKSLLERRIAAQPLRGCYESCYRG